MGEPQLPLVDSNDKAFQIIAEWKSFGGCLTERYGLEFQPRDLECLQGRYAAESEDRRELGIQAADVFPDNSAE